MARPVFEGVSEGRRRNMQANRSKDTKPETTIRRLLHAEGYRFRIHRYDLPGRPDIVFPTRRVIIEVRGCFWHGHGCRLGQLPSNRQDYWRPKIAATKERDQRNVGALHEAGWRVIEVWECEVRADPSAVMDRLREFLGQPRSRSLAGCSVSPDPSPVDPLLDTGDQPLC